MESTVRPTPRPGYARCVRCAHVFLERMLRRKSSRLWCPWCLEYRPGTPHGSRDADSCECRLLLR